jgi:nucleoside-diphosphate-sugar epimerase
VEFRDMRPGDLLYFICDTTKAAKELKWRPEVSPEEGIKRLVDWIKKEENIFKGALYESSNISCR